jgi:hypothetical protein
MKIQEYANSIVKRYGYKNYSSGWRVVGGKRIYFRSRREYNYSLFLQWKLERGEIISFEHEPETFWFEGIRRGTCSYLPDFKIKQKDESIVYCEVKGFMDSKSKTKLKRMAKYHPHIKIFLAGDSWFKANEKRLSQLIPHWEKPEK